VTDIAIDELARRLDEVTILDVRRASEYDGTGGARCDPRQGHIPGARHLDLDDLLVFTEIQLRETLGDPDDGGEIVVYCHSGSRSAFAAQVLRAHGYDVRNYVGSWHEWSRADLPSEV
jgi:3-mercaptopyruvate sulfurtransferase SseA